MLGKTTTTKPLLKEPNLGAAETQSIFPCRECRAVTVREENLPIAQ